MRRIVICTIVLLCAFPALASAWFLITQATSSGGTLTSRNKTNQTSVDGQIYRSYTTHAPLTAVVSANTGYSIRSVTYNGVVTSAPASPYTLTVQGPTDQNVSASFMVQYLSVTASATGGGIVTPTSMSNIYYGYKLTSPQVFQFRPNSGFALTTLTGASGATVSSPIPAPKDTIVNVTYPTGYVFTSNVNLVGNFSSNTAVAVAGSPQAVLTGSLVTLTGSYTGGNGTPPSSYTWTEAAGPTTVTLAPNGNKATFKATVPGTYTFTLTLDSGSTANTRVVVANSLAAEMRNQCQNCHQTNNPAGAPAFFKWSSSRHKPAQIVCAMCHVGADNGGHPGALSATPCNNCHIDAQGRVPLHPFAIGANPCSGCHNSHTTVGTNTSPASPAHFNNLTGAGYPASFNSSRSTCVDCHYDSTDNASHRTQWSATGHAAVQAVPWAADDFKTMNGCVQCHTTTGFIAYSTGKVTAAWGSSADKTKEILSCVGCHTDIIGGTVRNVTPVKPYPDDSYQNRNVGKSNLCFDCHSGTNSGASISSKIGRADFTNLPIIEPHYMPAAGNLHGSAGYRFPAQSYDFYSSNSHRMIGMFNRVSTGFSGPCVACHMSSTQTHTLKAASTDSNGTVTGISTSVCANCHGSSLTPASMNASKADFLNAMSVLKAMLASRGFVYSEATHSFPNTNWGSDEAGANAMGAAYNFLLLQNDPGVYAHNPTYARRLVSDSIDALYNGRVTGSINSAVNSLVSSGAITQNSADQATGYKAGNATCISCHDASNTGSHAKHAFDNLACSECHNATAVSSSTLVAGNASHLNGQVDVLIAPINNAINGLNYNKGTKGCSSITCHGNGTQTMTWGGTATCESCHTGTLSIVDGVRAQDRSLNNTTGHGRPGIGDRCVDCHDAAKKHIGGGRMLKDFLTGELNTECNYCHNNTSLIPDSLFNRMKTHVTKTKSLSDCCECHDPHGTTNFAMLRTTILGQPITVRDATQLVDLTTNMGFCQVCHTATKYFRAGVPETLHDTSQCMDCHDHKSNNGGFLNRPIKQCDSCHGYPPAPRLTPLPVRFGVMYNWTSATFERYSGGGGAHLVAAHVPKGARAKDGWDNCVMCHDPNNHKVDLMAENPPPTISKISVVVQQQYRFDNRFIVYTGAKMVDPPKRNVTGGCFNLSCHMAPTRPWSIER
jgi:trimeric autotransporter adhesin